MYCSGSGSCGGDGESNTYGEHYAIWCDDFLLGWQCKLDGYWCNFIYMEYGANDSDDYGECFWELSSNGNQWLWLYGCGFLADGCNGESDANGEHYAIRCDDVL